MNSVLEVVSVGDEFVGLPVLGAGSARASRSFSIRETTLSVDAKRSPFCRLRDVPWSPAQSSWSPNKSTVRTPPGVARAISPDTAGGTRSLDIWKQVARRNQSAGRRPCELHNPGNHVAVLQSPTKGLKTRHEGTGRPSITRSDVERLLSCLTGARWLTRFLLVGLEHLAQPHGERLRLARIPELAAEEPTVVARELDRVLAEQRGRGLRGAAGDGLARLDADADDDPGRCGVRASTSGR